EDPRSSRNAAQTWVRCRQAPSACAGSCVRARRSCVEHLQIGAASLRAHADDGALAPAVGAGKRVDLVHETARRVTHREPKKARGIEVEYLRAGASRARDA